MLSWIGFQYMWPSPHKPPTCRILSKLRLIHHQRTHLLLIRMVLLFSQSDFPVQRYELLNVNNTQLEKKSASGRGISAKCLFSRRSRLFVRERVELLIELFWEVRENKHLAIRNLISIARGTYNARKFWTRKTSGSVSWRTITWKYAYKNLTLQSGSPTRYARLLRTFEVAHAIEVRVLTIELWTHVT